MMMVNKLTLLFCLLTSSVFSQTMTLTSLSPSSGATSAAVTLNGTGLGNTINVFFGTAASAISSVSSTQVIVTVPSSLGGGTYSVYASTGVVHSNSLNFFVGNTFTPTTTFTPTNTPTGSPTPTPTATSYVLVNQNAGVNGSGQIVGVSPTWTPVPIPTMLVPIATPYVANGTVTIQPGILWIEGWLVGGGAGGWGSGTSQGTSPGNGGNTVFALSSPITCNGGVTATAFNANTGGLGGSFTIGTSVSGQGVTGGLGGSTQWDATFNVILNGGFGGHGAFGNSGAGGAGGYTSASGENSGAGGGGGGGVHFFWAVTPGATVPITIGGTGSGGGAGGSGQVGLVGQPGSALIIQHYN